MGRQLALDDIIDLRAYERVREDVRRQTIELKRRRRVAVGPIVTLLFENRDTIWFQVQEMARAERMTTDAAITGELDAYNPLIPEPGQLSATLFVELTGEEALRHWLPRLVGIERSVELRLGGAAVEGDGGAGVGREGTGPPIVVRSVPEAAHEQALTRKEVTAAVHYIRFELDPAQVDRFSSGPVVLAVTHPEYQQAVTLDDPVRTELLADLQP